MKKTLIALTVAAVAATSANATVVYNQDGTKVDVGGSVRLLLQKEKDKRTDLKDKGSRLVVKANQDLGEDLSALANLEIRFTDKGDIGDKISTKRVYAGFKLENVGTLTFGKQLTTGDEVGLSDYSYNLGGINKVVDAGDKVVHFRSAEWNGFGFGADYAFGSSDKKEVNENAWVLGAFYAQQFGDVGFKFDGGYSENTRKDGGDFSSVAPYVGSDGQPTYVHKSNGGKHKEKAFTVGTELSYGPFAFAVDFAQRKADKGQTFSWRVGNADNGGSVVSTIYNKVQELEVGLKYQFIEKSKVYFDYIYGRATYPTNESVSVDKIRNVPKARLQAFILGVDYKIHKNVVTYLEGGTFRYKNAMVANKFREKYNDHKVGLGLRVFF